jgi:hypothetical protein
VRVACSDEVSGKIGSDSDFIEVPKLGRGNIVLSSLVFPGGTRGYNAVVPASAPTYFTPGQKATFVYQVLRAPDANPAGERGLHMVARLFRDAKEIHATAPALVETDAKKSTGQFYTRGEIGLPADLEPGEYLLRVDVKSDGGHKPQLAWRWARITVRNPA